MSTHAGVTAGSSSSARQALLVDLSVAGGIGLPSIAGTFWLPLALGLRGNRPAFRREAKTALRLDQATPHADKKLPAKLREELTSGLDSSP